MTAPDHRKRMSTGRYRALVTLALVAAGAALLLGVRATQTGDDEQPEVRAGGGDVVERLIPERGDQVLRQTEIGIDLAPGHEATLIVNGQPIPDDELRRVPEQNQVFYRPGEGTTFPELPAGTSCVIAVVWHSADGPGVDDQTVRWCFDAA